MSSVAVCEEISTANTVRAMSKSARRELTDEEREECSRLKAVFEKRKAEARDRGEKLTQADVGDACGWRSGQSAVNQYFNAKVPLNVDALLKLSEVLSFKPSEVSPRLAREISNIAQSIQFEPGPPIVSPWRHIKIVGTAQMGTQGYWYAIENGDGYVEFPSRDPGAYALRLKGNSMAPAIKNGWVAVVEPNGQLIPGEYVMVRLHDGESMVKELLYANDVEVSLASVNDAYDRRTIPVEQIEHIHYVGAVCPPSKVKM